MANSFDMNGLQFKGTRKKEYTVYVCMPPKGTKVTNKLEGASYTTNEERPFVISGTVGEQWVIDAGKLIKTYCFANGMELSPDTLKARVKNGMIEWMHLKTRPFGSGEMYFAAHLPLSVKNYPVQTSWGDVLYANRDGVPHGNGDFLVCPSVNGQPNPNDMWVVNGEVFATTYDMRAFPGLGSKVKNKETPLPASLIPAGMGKMDMSKAAEWLINRFRSVYINFDSEICEGEGCFRLHGQKEGLQISFNSNNTILAVVIQEQKDWEDTGKVVAKTLEEVFRGTYKIIMNTRKKHKENIIYGIVNGLRQRGNRVGKIVDKNEDTSSFTVNNGKYGVILYINEGDPESGSNSISIMYNSNGDWAEAATWFMEENDMEENINRIHTIVNGTNAIDGLASRVDAIANLEDDAKFSSYDTSNNRPVYFKQLLKTYHYVKDRMQLADYGENGSQLITKTGEEPIHWRIDFIYKPNPNLSLFIDIRPDIVTPCIIAEDGCQWEEDFETGADGCKQAFLFIRDVLKDLN